MEEQLFKNFVDLVRERTGLCLDQGNPEVFSSKILARIRSSCVSTEEDYFRLLAGTTAASRLEWEKLAPLLTIGESYFFRIRAQFELLRDHILPELINRRRAQRRLRIWSAGCSSGEEPYSIAMLLSELLPDADRWDLLILGTDLNGEALEKAATGVFSRWSFRMVDAAQQQRHFVQKKESWTLSEKIRDMVSFRRHNLVGELFPDNSSGLHHMDLILCRNVFIYFEEKTVNQVVERFGDTLNDDGYLLTGHCELSPRALVGLSVKTINDQIIFQKISPGARMVAAAAAQKKAPLRSLLRPATHAEARSEKTVTGKKNSDNYRTDSNNIPPATGRAGNQSSMRQSLARPEATEGTDQYRAHLTSAQAYADRGAYAPALRSCEQAIELAPMAPEPLFLCAQICEATGDNSEAKNLLKKVIYLEPAYVAAYLELGTLCATEQDTKLAQKMLAAAGEILSGLPPESPMPPYLDMTAGELLQHAKILLSDLEQQLTSRNGIYG
ncbi:chemotaxis protein methyltransferase CheR [Desulfuromusa kysingii]|uniref:protein-glutamate O-methyltransferase n=1 Tax=Desulfuromusa kysingii TaxID=37625 RepID=A0A1H3VZH8_9BACT|nr:CheR family methyltransferase [Desulfuromusa kysingii]SDZ80209.1 chemotaxis protein methyltransferase CheR [Desulfuromusa kysingii]